MDRERVISTLRQHQNALRRHGVAHAALFGSLARDDARPDSDIDILIDLDPRSNLSAYDYWALKEYIADLFEGPVDVVNGKALKPYLRPAVLGQAIYAF